MATRPVTTRPPPDAPTRDARTPMHETARFTIGEAASRSGVSAKMVRHYESLGLLPRVDRTASGYRLYRESDVHTLRFIRRARDLGFSLGEVADLLRLWQDRRRASADVKRIALSHAEDLERRIADLQQMQATLRQLADGCHGDDRPECPILDELAAPGGVSLPGARPLT
jgi:Cu(I)-responsive transcriptional regulator